MSQNHRLGQWAVIDIETTGADFSYDQVIDLGYLYFEGTKLVRKYSKLVQFEGELSSFIQKLTGITSKMLRNAPSWKEVEGDLQELYGVNLIAHNSEFEANFLTKSFDKVDDGSQREIFHDSLLLLGLLYPEFPNLKLETFIQEWEIADTETHRGYEDSLDLLKVILIASRLTKLDKEQYQFIKMQLLEKKILNQEFYLAQFLHLDDSELDEIAEQIDFDLNYHVEVAKKKLWQRRFPETHLQKKYTKNFPLDFNGMNIKNIFANEEKIRTMFPTYKMRQSQMDLALKVGQSFKNSVHSLIQAPTGTGKTFGYLIPSALFALEDNKPVLVATGTKTLQAQAYEKDVPIVREFLGLAPDELKVKMLVGSGNHLCESLFRQEEGENSLLELTQNFNEAYASLFFEMIFFYNQRVTYENKIIRDNISYVLKKKIPELQQKDADIAVDFRSCSGNNCPFKNQCSYLTGLREAKEAHIIIGNHSLMLSWPKGMPRPLNIVIDEAHKIEEEATSAFSLEVDQKSFELFVQSLQHMQGVGSLFYLLAQNEKEPGESSEVIRYLREETLKTQQMLNDHVVNLRDKMSLYFKKMPKYTENYWNELPMINPEVNKDSLAQNILGSVLSIHFILETYLAKFLPYSGKFEAKNLKNENETLAFTRFETFFSQLTDLVVVFETLKNLPAKLCCTMKYLESDGYLFNCAPIDVGQLIFEQVLSTSASVVFTSATLANGQGDTGARGIEWATGYSYLTPDRRFKTGTYLPCTFDYKNKTRVFLCDDVPSMYQNNFVEYNLNKIKPLIKSLGGRTLLLFSAKTRFEIAREILLKEFEGQIPLFIQGMGTNVVEEFKKAGNGILLGMESFGEGIDVPGEALQFIFIDKIPDLRMDKVITDRRDFYEANIGNEFTDYYLAHRTRSLHQKLGRLLRREDDYGGAIIVDGRIKSWKGRTMESVNRLMEPYHFQRAPIDEAIKEIESFIKGHSDH